MKKLLVLSLLSCSVISSIGAGCNPCRPACQPAACQPACQPACPAKPKCYKTVMVPKQIMCPKVVEVPAIEKRIKQAPTCERKCEYYKVPVTVYETRCRWKTIWHAQPDIVCYECPVDTMQSAPRRSGPACPVC
jgi:hypothetical protein